MNVKKIIMPKHSTESLPLKNNEPDVHQELKYIASGTGLMFVGTMFSNVISLIYGILVARVIGAKLLGIFYLGTSVTGLITLAGTFGLSHGIFRYIGLFYAKGNFQAIRKTIRWILSVVAIISVSLSFLVFLLAKIIAVNWFHQPELTIVLVLLTITVPLGCLKTICLSSVQALYQIKYRVYVQSFITPLVRSIVVVGLFFFGWRLMAVVVGSLASSILSTAMAGYYLRKVLQKQPQSINEISEDVSIGKIVRFSLPLFASELSNIPSTRIVIWLLGAFWSVEAVAIYGVANRLKVLGTFVFQSLNSVFAPMISGLHDTGQLKKLEKLYKTTTRWCVSLGMPIYLLLILLAQKFLNLYGEAFVAGAIPLVLLCLGEIVYIWGSWGAYMVAMSGHPEVGLYNGIATAVLTIVLSFIAIPRYGITGAAFAVTIAYTCVNLIRLIEIYYFLRMHPYDRNYIKPVSSAGIASLSLILITRVFSIRFPYDLIIYLMAFFTIYAGLLFVMGLNQEESGLLQDVKLRLLGKFNRR